MEAKGACQSASLFIAHGAQLFQPAPDDQGYEKTGRVSKPQGCESLGAFDILIGKDMKSILKNGRLHFMGDGVIICLNR